MSLSSPGPLNLKWEWSADRMPTARILVEVGQVRKEGRGLFGLKVTPSIIDNLPDSHILTGMVLAGDHAGSKVSLRIPKIELPDVANGDRVGLGLIGDVCICIVPEPADLADDDVATWLSSFPCES